MYFLGMSGGVLIGNQDGAAALMKDGELVAAVEEERMLRIKHASGRLPRNAIAYCLKQAGITIRDVDAVAFAGATYNNFEQILKDYFEFQFGYAPPVHLVDHHTAHAASAYYMAPFCAKDALAITFDYSGDRASTLVFKAQGGGPLQEVMRIPKPNSLGIFYSVLTQYLGFEKDSDEYKVMGLSSYGEPKYDMSWMLAPEGDSYRLNPAILKGVKADMPAPSKQERIYGDLKLPRPGRLHEDTLDQYFMDVAASGQDALEKAALNLVKHAVEKTGIRRLCVAGGVALNCVMNQRIRESGMVDELFVPPHTSDAGLSIGCAIILNQRAKRPMPKPMTHCYWGPGHTEDHMVKVLDRSGVRYQKPADICDVVANDIMAGKIVGWFQGRMEFGPRALGNRSILADPRVPGMTDRINALVKFREEFRPFAPSILLEAAGDYFERACPSPYMCMTFNVRPDKRSVIPAVTHVDHTARVQTVEKSHNELYYKLISTFGAKTGVPVIVNTSFNVQGQPILLDPKDALSVFYSTGMQSLAVGPFYLTK